MQIITFTTTVLIYALMPDNILRIDCAKAEEDLNGTMQIWIDAEDSLEVW